MHYYAVLSTVKRLKDSERRRVDLGRSIRRRREALGLSQEGLAERIDCHRNYVGLVERGEQNVTIDMLGRIGKALSSTVTELVQEAGL